MHQILRNLTGWTATITLLTLVAACSTSQSPKDTSQSTVTPTQGSGNNSSGETALKPSEPSRSTSTHKIGEVVSVNDKNINVQFTVNGIREHQGKGVITPAPGNKWIVVSTTIANKGQETKTYSVVSFELIDSKNKQYDVDLLAGASDDIKSPTGELKPGNERRGEVAFEVPENAKGLKLLFQANTSECEAPASQQKASEMPNCEPVVVNLQ